ncbi:MAG: bifunctional glutamate N-acetyltransferase/amino-acid acetyltransferase ArgJ [Anaerolineae bacterium]|nr:bifunctional glutamate N-acetyltransferase/amino-acid acetyltransferase ArgJ [Anaerolineae bacterium]MCO5197434.1 bifunctional glutamate N-acetyltransferase/amino-acid acetyltransferase ArgJ [Anaerolineae bacterium]
MTITSLPNGSITSPRGFRAGSVIANIKYRDRLDLTLLVSDTDCATAGVFTRSQVVAAPVIVSRETLQANAAAIRAVVANAGNANACTGEPGLVAARAMQQAVGDALGFSAECTLVLSTGVIGLPMPVDKLRAGIDAAAKLLNADGGQLASQAIMTTDTHPKSVAVQVALSGGAITIGGMAKGSGMIHPDMATMLGVITTDAAIDPSTLHSYLRRAVAVSFNRISVDGDTSTNDTVLLLANGVSGIEFDSAEDDAAFLAGLTSVCQQLAHMIVRDGEGATKFVEITVNGTSSDTTAHAIANTIATSPLVKTAFAGSDPNWGRILAAAGRAGVSFDQTACDLWIGNDGLTWLQLLASGTPTDYAEDGAAMIFAASDIVVRLSVGCGDGTATVWTCDLSHDYVTINADYRT